MDSGHADAQLAREFLGNGTLNTVLSLSR